MKIEWTASDTYIIGKTNLNKTFKKVAGDIKWKDSKGELTIINPILEGGLEVTIPREVLLFLKIKPGDSAHVYVDEKEHKIIYCFERK